MIFEDNLMEITMNIIMLHNSTDQCQQGNANKE